MINYSRPVNSILLLLLAFLTFSCSKKDQQYFYAHYYGEDSIPSSYLVRKVQNEKDYRTDIIFSSKTKEGSFKQTNKEKYRLLKGRLDKVVLKDGKKVQQPYLTTLNEECVDFLYGHEMDDVISTSLCFLGKEDVLIGDKKYNNAYKFKKILGLQHKIESIVYYDTDFILLKEEYVSGYTDQYRIIRLDTSIVARK